MSFHADVPWIGILAPYSKSTSTKTGALTNLLLQYPK